MKIFKADSNEVFASDLANFFYSHGVLEGHKFGISWKFGKKRKLRSYRLISRWMTPMCWDDYTIDLTIAKGEKRIILDDSFAVCLQFDSFDKLLTKIGFGI